VSVSFYTSAIRRVTALGGKTALKAAAGVHPQQPRVSVALSIERAPFR